MSQHSTASCLNSDCPTTRFVTRDAPDIEPDPVGRISHQLPQPQTGRKGEGGLRTREHFKKSLPGKPLISVITVVFNDETYLEETMQSVFNQTYDNVEYIVIDGGSTDGTVDIIKRHEEKIDYWSSEPDQGIYYAMNKGILLVHDPDSYIYYLNSGDTFNGNTVLSTVVETLPDVDFWYGRINLVDEETCITVRSGSEIDPKNLLFGMASSHQTMLCRRWVFDVIGGFDCRYRIVADYDWVNRVFRNPAVTRKHGNIVVANMRSGGASDINYLLALQERGAVVATYYSSVDRFMYLIYRYSWATFRYGIKLLLRRLGLRKIARQMKYKMVRHD